MQHVRQRVDEEYGLLAAPPARGVLREAPPDGRIEGLRVLPSAALAPFVHHFWSVRWSLRTPFSAEALMHPSAQIVLEEQDGVQRTEVAGVRTGRCAIRRTGQGRAFGITFRAAMFQPLLRRSMWSVTGRVVPAPQVLGPRVDALALSIHTETDLSRKIELAEAFLLPLLSSVRPEVARLRDLVESIGTERGLLRVDDVCDRIGLDERTLQRSFRRYVGVSPKWVIQRYRLLEAAEQLKTPHPPPLAGLAVSLGYADQSHFTRAFRLVVGQTPRTFASNFHPR